MGVCVGDLLDDDQRSIAVDDRVDTEGLGSVDVVERVGDHVHALAAELPEQCWPAWCWP